MGMREYMLYDAQKKSGALAFVLCFFFGMTGAHRFYTGRFLTGGLLLLLFLVGIASTWMLVGYVPLALVGLWVIVDCFLVLGWVRKHNVALLNRLERADQPADDDVDAVRTPEPVAKSPVPGSVNQSGKRLTTATIGVVALVALAAIGDHEFPQMSLPWRGHHVSTDHGSVSAQQGNIIYTDASGATLAMTESGADSDPKLSPDGSEIVFVRTVKETDGNGGAQLNDLWTVGTRDHVATRLVKGTANDDPEKNLTFINKPTFSNDGQTIYFMAQAYATTDVIHALGVRGGKIREVAHGATVDVVRVGKYAGYLVVNQHRYFEDRGGSWNPYVLLSPEGKEIKVIGQDDKSLQMVESEEK